MTDFAPYLFILGGLILASAFFSGTEVALFSLRRVDKEQLSRSERAGDRRIAGLLSKPERLIATLLLGNECVNVAISTTMAGLCEILFPARSGVQLGLITTFLALPLLLFLGEITPKTVAIKMPMRWAKRAARPLWMFSIVIAPARLVVRGIAHAVLSPFGATGKPKELELGEDEFKALVDAGNAEGQVDAHERRLIHRVFEFGDKRVSEVMLPRDKVFALSYDLPLSRLTEEVADRGFSRVPIYSKSLDNVRGLLYAKDLLVRGVGGNRRQRLSDVLHDPVFVPQTIPIATLFRIFKQRRTHMALVVNEYGRLTGLCTMEDLLEELFGEIRDEREEQKSQRRPTLITPVNLAAIRRRADSHGEGP